MLLHFVSGLLFCFIIWFFIHRLLVIAKRRVKGKKAKMTKDQPPHWWWLDNHSTTRQSPWLQSTLAELNDKTKAILKLIEEDADSFAQRAEMYYNKRPELIGMVEDFYRTQRSLAERYDQVKSDTGIRLLTTAGSPFASARDQSENLMGFIDLTYDSYSENCDVEESVESEIDDPEHQEATKFTKEDEVPFVTVNDEVMRLREEIEKLKDEINQKDAGSDEELMLKEEIRRLREKNMAHRGQLEQKDALCDKVMILREEIGRLREENRAQKDELKQKDKEKIEVIRQLSLAIDMLKQENVKVRNFIAKDYYTKKWKNPFEFNKLKGVFSGKLINWSQRNQPSMVAL